MQRTTITNLHTIYFELEIPIYAANIQTKMHFCHWNESQPTEVREILQLFQRIAYATNISCNYTFFN